MIYAGLDISLTGTGLVLLDDTEQIVLKKLITTKPGDFASNEARYSYIASEILSSLKPHRPFELSIEGPAYAAKEKRIYECAAVIKHELWKRGVVWELVQPGTLKRFGAGNGRASKKDMIKAAQVVDPTIKNDNIADAYFLASHCKRRVSYFPDALDEA